MNVVSFGGGTNSAADSFYIGADGKFYDQKYHEEGACE